MANTVYDTEEIELSDGSALTLKPLTIKTLREFQPKWKAWTTSDHIGEDTENAELESMIKLAELAIICVKAQRPDWVETPELAEDVLDMETVLKIIEVCAGYKLNDPKLTEAALKIVAEQQAKESVGTS